jgi:prepilin-type N-terminal cleavage/methylation domain-containing protein
MIHGKHYDGKYEPVCECIDESDAHYVCDALNAYQKRRAFTLVEALTVLAILATLVSLLVPAILAARKNADHMTVPSVAEDSEPPESWTLCTVKHSGHWFVVGDKWGMHHPDCPCQKSAEAAQ